MFHQREGGRRRFERLQRLKNLQQQFAAVTQAEVSTAFEVDHSERTAAGELFNRVQALRRAFDLATVPVPTLLGFWADVPELDALTAGDADVRVDHARVTQIRPPSRSRDDFGPFVTDAVVRVSLPSRSMLGVTTVWSHVTSDYERVYHPPRFDRRPNPAVDPEVLPPMPAQEGLPVWFGEQRRPGDLPPRVSLRYHSYEPPARLVLGVAGFFPGMEQRQWARPRERCLRRGTVLAGYALPLRNRTTHA
jgi:hypothetical protein